MIMVFAAVSGIKAYAGTDALPEDPEYYKKQMEENQQDLVQASFTEENYVHNDRFSNATIRNGIDVSYYQGEIDWNKVKKSGVEFVFIRVGYRGYDTGGLAQDPKAKEYLEGATKAGLKVGAYIFSQAITPQEAEEEAAYVIAQVAGFDMTMPIVMDYEYVATGVGRLYNAQLSQEAATAVVNAFGAYARQAGFEPMIYANKSMLTNSLNADNIPYKIWLANYTTQTTYEGRYEFWQYTSEGIVDGISGSVDCDFWYDFGSDNIDPSKNGWYEENGKKYWYDHGIMARDKEVWDPETDAWYWFDADGAMAVNKDVFIPTNAQRTEGKWVRYDEKGSMIKGEDYRYGGWYWFDPITGEMKKGFAHIPDETEEGKWVYYDEITGQMHHGESCLDGNWYYFDDWTGKMVHGEYYRNENWYYYDIITGIMSHGWTVLPDGRELYYDEITGILQ